MSNTGYRGFLIIHIQLRSVYISIRKHTPFFILKGHHVFMQNICCNTRERERGREETAARSIRWMVGIYRLFTGEIKTDWAAIFINDNWKVMTGKSGTKCHHTNAIFTAHLMNLIWIFVSVYTRSTAIAEFPD